ncbi:MAG: hypothetical protein ABR974_13090 [Bacteroidales bacterium]|jgi:hypothetical protein
MKRIIKIAFIAGIALFFLSSLAGAQEKKEQQKIKIVVADSEGTKVVIDTTFSGSSIPDSITLKNGSVFYIKNGCHGLPVPDKMGQKEENITVKVSSDVNVSAGDKGGDKHRMVYYYVNNSGGGNKDEGDKYNIRVSSDEPDTDIEKSSYVIAKDGMVVTIEGGNEEKVRELAAVIESAMGVNKDDKTGNQVVVKGENKITGKK